MNRSIELKIRDRECDRCKLQQDVRKICETGTGPDKARIMVVGKMPNSDIYQRQLEEDLAAVGFEPADMYFTAALKCRQFDMDASNTDVKACKTYLEQEVELVKPEWILALGNEALLAVTGHSGITKWRGREVPGIGGTRAMATLSPSAVNRNPGQRQAWVADLALFANMVFDKASKVPKMKLFVVDDKRKVKQLSRLLDRASLISYDIETFGFAEHVDGARIVSLAGTLVLDDGKLVTFALPLYHPESPFKSSWRSLLQWLRPHLERVPKQVAHNGKFDARWLRHHGINMRVTFDTMLAAHMLDENRQKGLKPQAASRLGVAPWAMDTKNLLAESLKQVLIYNALDTWYTYHIYLQMREELIAKPRLLRLYQMITMPANEILIDVERRGVWMDRERLSTRVKIAHDLLAEMETELTQWIPEGSDEELAAMGWPQMGKRGKLAVPNFNPSNWCRWWLFDHLGLPVLLEGKTGPSMKEAVMMELKGDHPAVPVMLKRATMAKTITFLNAYDDQLSDEDRIHTTFKLAGTVTGRLSSGKADEEKISGRVSDIKGVNLQQVPRDPFIRGLFGAKPGYTFVEADFSQVELRVVAFISRDRTMIGIYQRGEDIHAATASWVLGVPLSRVTKDDRKKAKAVNFGFVYGMGARKFVQTAFEKYELTFTEEEAKEIRKTFFANFSGLMPWHARQRRMVNLNGRVVSPLGRVRNLPDIYSGDPGVRGEAERQAINSPVQSFASDMTMLSMILIQSQFKELGLDAHFISTVHDALLFEVRDDLLPVALPIIKETMQNLPLKRKFGCSLDVPIIADLKIGTHWGDAKELSEEEYAELVRAS